MLDCLLGWPTWAQIALGFAATLFAGHLVVGGFHRWGQNLLLPRCDLRKLGHGQALLKGFLGCDQKSMYYDRETSPGRIPTALTGTIERAIFAIVTVVDPSTAAIGMAGWLVLKMAAKWQRDPPESHRSDEWSSGAFLAALTGLMSMFIAGAGGFAIREMLGKGGFPT